MVKASALYIVIIIALVIAVLCSALIASAYFYKSQYQQKFRYSQLQLNTGSGINILLNSQDSIYQKGRAFSLFDNGGDSVLLKKSFWGVFDVCTVEAFIQKDSLYKSFTIANGIDSAKWAALYLIDEDRPLSVSGKTHIEGDAYIPKAGIKPAYIDNQAYEGDERIIIGKQYNSQRKLPALSETRLLQFKQFYDQFHGRDSVLSNIDSISQSFKLPVHIFNFKKNVTTIQHIKLNGNIILYSDTTLIIDSTASLNNIMIFAKDITVKSGFHGNCQLYATDSLSVEQNCIFNYPSCLGILRYTTASVGFPEKISLGANSIFNGIIFTYEKTDHHLPPIISAGKKTTVNGQIYSQGILNLQPGSVINGSAFTNRFLYQTSFTMYENYLINITISSKALSSYYLTSDLTPVAANSKKILQWLEVK